MRVSGCCLLLVLLVFITSFSPSINALSDVEASRIPHRQLRSLPIGRVFPIGFKVEFNFDSDFQNDRLKSAYVALQAWKKVIQSDPLHTTANWVGPNVCSYKGVFCHSPPDGSRINVVAGIDINGANIAGCLPDELGLLTDVALIHLNSNRFSGIIPESIKNLKLLYELDISNNLFVGPFPKLLLELPSLKFLDLRFNGFEGKLPREVFDKNLDALFLNNNKFCSKIPDNLGNSNVSVIVLSDNNLTGCIPPSIGNMSKTLHELNLANNELTGCLPNELGQLGGLKVLSISNNSLSGAIPNCFEGLSDLELMDVSCNKLTGVVPHTVCELANLKNMSIESNYFDGLGKSCQACSADFLQNLFFTVALAGFSDFDRGSDLTSMAPPSSPWLSPSTRLDRRVESAIEESSSHKQEAYD